MNTCPPGVICINHYNALGLLIITILIIYIINKEYYGPIYQRYLNSYNDNSNHNSSHNSSHNNHNSHRHLTNKELDMKVIEEPLYPPLSRNHYMENTNDYNNHYDHHIHSNNHDNHDNHSNHGKHNNHGNHVHGLAINIETRESGGDFQQVGVLSKNAISDDDKTPGNNTDTTILPLYGKPLYKGASKWLYYTETDKLNPVKIPINVNNRDCTDDYGCEELYDNGVVTIAPYNGTFNVKIYKFNKPRYIPYI